MTVDIKIRQTQLVKEFHDTWVSRMSFDCLSDKGKYILYSIIKDKKFSCLSARTLEGATGVGHTTFERMKNGALVIKDPDKTKNDSVIVQDNKKKKRGRHRKLTVDDENYIMRKAEDRRSDSKPVSIKWATEICNKRITMEGKHVSRFTIRRLFKRHGWKRRKAMRKQGYCLTSSYHQIIHNWKVRMQKFFSSECTGTVHIMDESGIYTNMHPRYTYVKPDDKFANVDTHPDTTKDTVVVTLSSDGRGSLFYVPFIPASKSHKGCSGVGKEEMRQWTIHFLSYAQKGDALIMDNLMAHHDASIKATLERHGIIVKYFPVRSASKLSPLDNCFFAILKRSLEERFLELIGLTGKALRRRKLEIIKEEFTKLIQKHIGVSYFRHCGYEEMGVRFERKSDVIFGCIHFNFDDDDDSEPEDDDDDNYFDFVSVDRPEFPKITTNGVTFTFAKALLAFLYANQIYREKINTSEDSLLQYLGETMNNANDQKSFSANKFFKSDGVSMWTLKQFIGYINAVTNNTISIANRVTNNEEVIEYLTVSNDKKMSCLITNDIVTRTPSIIPVFIESASTPYADFSFPYVLHCVSREGRKFFELQGFIGYCSHTGTYFAVSEHTDDKWVKMERGWNYFDKNMIPDYYIDVGFGHAVLLFYAKVTEGRPSAFLDITTPTESNGTIYDQPIPEMIHSALPLFVKRSRSIPPKEIGSLRLNKHVVGISNPCNVCHLNTVCQALFLIKDFVQTVCTHSKNEMSPLRELADIFYELKKPGPPIEPRNLLYKLDLQENDTRDIEETLYSLLEKINEILKTENVDIFEYFRIKEGSDSILDNIIRINHTNDDITTSIRSEYTANNCTIKPPILLVRIERHDEKDKKSKHVSYQINLPDADNTEYELYSISAYDTNHYMQYNRIDANSWIGIDDHTAFDVPDWKIHSLFGRRDDNRHYLKEDLRREWIAVLLFYKRADYDINSISDIDVEE